MRQQTQTTQILDFNQTPHGTVAAQHFDDMTPDELGGNNRQASHGNNVIPGKVTIQPA